MWAFKVWAFGPSAHLRPTILRPKHRKAPTSILKQRSPKPWTQTCPLKTAKVKQARIQRQHLSGTRLLVKLVFGGVFGLECLGLAGWFFAVEA